MSMKTLADAFHHELQDIYSAEKQLLKTWPKLVKKASCDKLTDALQCHLDETKQHIERVEQAFKDTGKAAKAKTCEAMKGLLTETDHMLKEDADCAVKDAIIIACAQKIEHYEIATYGTLCTWAEALGYDDAKKLLKQNIDDEECVDKKLTKLSKSINKEALAAC